MQFATEKEVAEAERSYKEALESQDSDRILKAQKALNVAMLKSERVKNFKPQAAQPQQQLPQQQTPAYNPPQDTYIDRNYRDWETDRKSTRLNSSH